MTEAEEDALIRESVEYRNVKSVAQKLYDAKTEKSQKRLLKDFKIVVLAFAKKWGQD